MTEYWYKEWGECSEKDRERLRVLMRRLDEIAESQFDGRECLMDNYDWRVRVLYTSTAHGYSLMLTLNTHSMFDVEKDDVDWQIWRDGYIRSEGWSKLAVAVDNVRLIRKADDDEKIYGW